MVNARKNMYRLQEHQQPLLPTSSITLLVEPTQVKLFFSKKHPEKSLLIIDAICVRGCRLRIDDGAKCLVHVRQSRRLSNRQRIYDVTSQKNNENIIIGHEGLNPFGSFVNPSANDLEIDVKSIAEGLITSGNNKNKTRSIDDSEIHASKMKSLGESKWVKVNDRVPVAPTANAETNADISNSEYSHEYMLIKAEPSIERNRKGDRLVECLDILEYCEDHDTRDFMWRDDCGCEEVQASTTNLTKSVKNIGPKPTIHTKKDRHKIFVHWLIQQYGSDFLSRGSGVLDVAGGNGEICRTLQSFGIPSTLVDPNPRCYDYSQRRNNGDLNNYSSPPFRVFPYALYGDGANLTSNNERFAKGDEHDTTVGEIAKNASMICGLHPDQATDPIVEMALRLNIPFAIVPCCVMPSLFPHRRQKSKSVNNCNIMNNLNGVDRDRPGGSLGDPVRSYSTYCKYLLNLATESTPFYEDNLSFVGRNKVIFSKPCS